MNMKKTIILLGLLLVMNYTAFAEQRGIFMDFHGDINPKKDMEVNRTPMKLTYFKQKRYNIQRIV